MNETQRRYKAAIATYRSRAAGQLGRAWDELDSLDEDDIGRFETKAAGPLAAAKAAAVTLSAAHFALALRIRPVGVRVDEVNVEANLAGPFHAAWHALAQGRPYAEAQEVGRSTAEATGFDYVQSAARRTGDVVAERSGRRVGWARLPGASSCDWCTSSEVADQTYSSAEAADFGHERCDCDVTPA